MAQKLGKTARHYRSNPKSRAKHVKDNNSGDGGKYAHTNEYKRTHYEQRKKLQIRKGSTDDAAKQPDGSYKRQHRKKNRGDK